MTTQIDQLALRLRLAKEAYYGAESPIMSDAEYDTLEEDLRKADPNHPVLKMVGMAPVGGSWPKTKHKIPMGSLNKAQINSEVASWIKGTANAGDIAVMDKLDGASCQLCYEKRHLVRGATRGDGFIGQDITRNILLMQGAVKILPPTINGQPTPDEVYVRGEVIVAKSLFAKHFKGESNPRNTANGTMIRQTNHDKCKHLSVIAYQYMPEGYGLETKKEELETLKDMGFITPKWSVVSNLDEIEAIYQDYINGVRDGLDYLIDGLVLEVNDRDKRNDLGDLNGRPKGAVAYKFPHESKPTTLKDVRWQVGNSGRITPVAEFLTVNLAGANISQASLHNLSNIKSMVSKIRPGTRNLCLNDSVLVSRRNDVIPYVEALLSDGDTTQVLETPTECPVCGEKLSMNGEYLVCTNSDECEAQVLGMLKRWVSKLEIKHMGEALLTMLIEDGHIEDIADLYTIDPVKVSVMTMNGRMVGASADRGFKNLHLKKALPVHVLVGALGIPLIGRSMAQTISDAGFDTISKMYKARIVEIAAISGVGQTKAESFVQGLEKKIGLISKLLCDPSNDGAGLTIKVTKGNLKGQTFCMTGFRDGILGDAIEAAGGTMKSGVSKALEFLIVQDITSNSSKVRKAKSYRTNIISIDEAKKMAGI